MSMTKKPKLILLRGGKENPQKDVRAVSADIVKNLDGAMSVVDEIASAIDAVAKKRALLKAEVYMAIKLMDRAHQKELPELYQDVYNIINALGITLEPRN